LIDKTIRFLLYVLIMRKRQNWLYHFCIVSILFFSVFYAENNYALIRSNFDESRIKTELMVSDVFSGRGVRLKNQNITGTIEYEWNIFHPFTMGVRGYPLFLYFSDKLIYGFGGGITNRYFTNSQNKSGVYVELGISLIWHSRYFPENSARVNFFSEFGIGYKFLGDNLQLGVKIHHLSNGNTADKNLGWNDYSLGVGYSFYSHEKFKK